MDPQSKPGKKTLFGRKKLLAIAAAALLAVVLLAIPAGRNAIISVIEMLGSADVEAVKAYILSFGALAVVISILLMILQSVAAPIPAFLITFANAAVFGWIAGAAVSWTGAMLGAAVCFGLARFLGRDVVSRLTGKGVLQSVDQFFVSYGAKSISEIACNGAAPAIGIAIHDACGVWLRSWPMTPEKVLKALGKI